MPIPRIPSAQLFWRCHWVWALPGGPGESTPWKQRPGPCGGFSGEWSWAVPELHGRHTIHGERSLETWPGCETGGVTQTQTSKDLQRFFPASPVHSSPFWSFSSPLKIWLGTPGLDYQMYIGISSSTDWKSTGDHWARFGWLLWFSGGCHAVCDGPQV